MGIWQGVQHQPGAMMSGQTWCAPPADTVACDPASEARCRCPCDGCTVGRVWYTPGHAELDTHEPPESPCGDQGDMQEQTGDMPVDDDHECEVYHDHELLQDQDSFDPATGEDEARGPTGRGRSSYAAAHRTSSRAGSAGADS